jgi:hypothetical protein
VNANVFARGSQTSALIANVMLLLSRANKYRYSSSWPGVAVRRTASLPLAYVPASTSFLLLRWEDVDARGEPGHDEFRYSFCSRLEF